ncbi:MAG: DUF4190 domain-containing protein, partial [Candidatus Nanopelagicales bacterium]
MSDPTTPPAGEPLPAAPATPITPAPQNGMGTAALVMGIVQFLCLPFIGGILAIIFGRIGMKKAKEGLATNGGNAKAGFWLGIVGIILSVIGAVVGTIILIVAASAINDSVDPIHNSETGLVDGNYGMHPDTYVRLNDRCSFSGLPVDLATQAEGTNSVSVVG